MASDIQTTSLKIRPGAPITETLLGRISPRVKFRQHLRRLLRAGKSLELDETSRGNNRGIRRRGGNRLGIYFCEKGASQRMVDGNRPKAVTKSTASNIQPRWYGEE